MTKNGNKAYSPPGIMLGPENAKQRKASSDRGVSVRLPDRPSGESVCERKCGKVSGQERCRDENSPGEVRRMSFPRCLSINSQHRNPVELICKIVPNF